MLNLKKKAGWYALGALVIIAAAHAATIVYNAALVNETALAYNNTYSLDLQSIGITSLSAQAIYSSATVAAQTFQDGTQSTGSFSVVTNTALVAASATNNITVLDNTALTGASLILPGYVLQQGIDWSVMDVASNTAASIRTALLTVPGLKATRAAGSSIVYTTAPATGSYYNSWPLVSSTPTALSVATPFYTGGLDNAAVSLNGVVLRQGQQWNAGATGALTATAIASAINSNSLLNKIVSAGAVGSVVTATSTLTGVNAFYLKSSTPTALAPNHPAMTGGTASSYVLNGQITIPAHGLTLGLPVLYSTGNSIVIGGLTNQTTYYVVPIDANTIGLSSTAVVALTGVYKTFTSSTTQLSAQTATLTPLPIAGVPSFFWQVSNDNSSWNTLAVSSVTMGPTGTAYAIPPTSTLWSFGYIGTRYLRLNVTAPTAGGISLNVRVIGTN